MPAISIIVPGYNAQMYLSHCLDSLMGQTLKDIEIIYIDAGSQDDTVRLVKEYAAADYRIKFCICRPIGTAHALNAGLDAASGTYIMFCEPDALYAPNMCEIMLKTIQKTHTDVVCCRIAPMYQLPPHRSEAIPAKGAENIEFKDYGRHRLDEKYRTIEGVIPWNKIWKGQLIEKYHIRFWARTGYEYDSFWSMYAFVARDMYCLRRKLYCPPLPDKVIRRPDIHKKNAIHDCMALARYLSDFALRYHLGKQVKTVLLRLYYRGIREACFMLPRAARQGLCKRMNILLSKRMETEYPFVYSKGRILYVAEPLSLWRLYPARIKGVLRVWFCPPHRRRFFIKRLRETQLYWDIFKNRFHQQEMFCYQPETACLVSVIIPVCNAARYLNECLKSVSAQTLQDIEIICVDDDSKDGSFTLLKRRASHEVRLRVLKNAQHMGTSYAKNKGLAAARGEYVYFLGAIDWIEPEALKRLYDFATAHPVDIAGAATRPYYTYTKSKTPLSSRFFKKVKNYLQSEDERSLSVTADNFKEVLRLSFRLENRLYRRDFLRRHNLWFCSGHEPYEDESFWIKLMSCFPTMSFMKQAGYFCRIHKEKVGEQTKQSQKSARQALTHGIRAAAEYMRLHQKEVLLPMLFDRYDFCFGSSIHIGKVLTVDWYPKHKVLKIAAVTVFSKHRLPEQQTYEMKILGVRIDLWHKYIKRLCCRMNGADV